MDHVAIMKKSWGLLPKILSGEKKIESRWYSVKASPWGRINEGELIYFKNSGEPVTVRSIVAKVRSFEGLTPKKVWKILLEYGAEAGIIPQGHPFRLEERGGLRDWYNLFKNKRYCLLIFLENAQKINPFDINKKGFGSMAAWISISDVSKIRCE